MVLIGWKIAVEISLNRDEISVRGQDILDIFLLISGIRSILGGHNIF